VALEGVKVLKWHFAKFKVLRWHGTNFPLFFLAAEGLHKILSMGIVQGHFEGLGPVLSNQQKIMHL
jgi:hypothetical protein